MFDSKTNIRLAVHDAGQASSFYEALFGAPPTKRDAASVTFDLESPPIVLVIEKHPPKKADARAFDLRVNEPQHVGEVAIALRRAGVRLHLEDQGVRAHDPDGNAWAVRFVPSTQRRAVVATQGGLRAHPNEGGRRP